MKKKKNMLTGMHIVSNISFFMLTLTLMGILFLFPTAREVGAAKTTKSPDFTIEQILSYPFPFSLTASLEGQRIAWVFNHQGVHNIWLAEGPDFQCRQLTNFEKDDGKGLSIMGFIEKGAAVIFSQSGTFNPAHDPKWDGKSILYKLNCQDGKMEKLAETGWAEVSPKTNLLAYSKKGELYIFSPGEEAKKRMKTRGDLARLEWSPDGSKLVMESRRGEFPHRYSYILIYDPGQEKITYIDASVYSDFRPTWSPDNKRIAFLRRLTHGHRSLITARKFPVADPWEIRVADVENGKTIKVWKSPPADSFAYVRIAWLDNEHVVFLSEGDGWRHLYAVPAAGGEARQLTKGKFEVEQFTAVPSLKKVFFNSNANDIDRRHIWWVDIRGNMKPVTKVNGIQWSPVVTGNNRYIAYIGSTALMPAQVYVKPINGGKAVKLAGDTLPDDFPKKLVIPKQVIFKSEDGWKIHGQLFNPPKSFKGKRPAIMYFHGGPVRQMLLGFHYSSYYHRCYAMNQYLASRGYVVLSVNYRLGIGYGRVFREVPDAGPRGCSEYRDLLAGAKFLRSLEYVDSNRIGLWGGSYGGLMTALGLARNSDLFAAGVDLHGVHDWNQWQAWASERENDNNRTVWKSSPLSDIHNWRSPVLLIHGDDDRNVPFSETLWLVETLERQGVEYELLVFPDDVHSFLLHQNWVKAFKTAGSFFDRKL
ncbi:MAG: prolyl oligopeptidase family serine peptidase [Candidatus Aminicenantes bacterium]|nr:prolyl oligopeptidase family serine peptidase [Candidatus Aminicenantes bacterium]NIM80801.1 prolyl oligopeptidase family serine peptidase [Candidatus Aminicenantes bacterium]NIN20184.1 prolyl oligopeptidase family serine peptidase [Candidatus Aminicenantes bacterium]NIN43963.1 prolyl oligopeptidase family serine peptidase [Candidatus Aminicenantes bacterium]NIN86772.1 prolyl oligopeptidase family serine peptidase [Candidatus Aminicenantes bacterium]